MGHLYVGAMSGTSLDGLDLVLLEIDRPFAARELDFHWEPYPPALREALLDLIKAKAWPPHRFLALHDVLGQFFGKAIRDFLDLTKSQHEVRAIGLHGQTLWHLPTPEKVAGWWGRGTLQIGNAAQVRRLTGVPVIFDFRSADMAQGGHGAPLAPFLDKLLFSNPEKGKMALNIGGIANVTFLPPQNGPIIAFDTGPGNMIMDALMAEHPHSSATFDRNGEIAASGTVIPPLLEECKGDGFFAELPPKSTGREHFGIPFLRHFKTYQSRYPYQDLLATAAHLTADTIADAVRDQQERLSAMGTFHELIVSGGGVRNPFLIRLLADNLPGVELVSSEAYGVNPDAKEAWLFAALAWAHCEGIPGNIPSVTGAQAPVILGGRMD